MIDNDRPSWPPFEGIMPTATVAVRLPAYGPHLDYAAKVCLAVGDDAALEAFSPALEQIAHVAKQIDHPALDRAKAAVARMKIEDDLKRDLTFYFERWRPRADQVAAERAQDAARRAADQKRAADQARAVEDARAQRHAEYVAGLQQMVAEEDRRRGRRA